MRKYGVQHPTTLAYHPQTNGQAKVSNGEIKSILEKTVNSSKKDWAKKIDDALWAYRTTFKTPLGMSLFRLVFGKACHFPVELQHRSYWATRQLNMDSKRADEKCILPLSEVEEFRNEAYENAKIYKENTKSWHNKHIVRREFELDQRVFLFNSRLKLFPRKLKSGWSGPFTMTQFFPYGGVEIMHPEKRRFKVNAQGLKPYFGGTFHASKQSINLSTSETMQ